MKLFAALVSVTAALVALRPALAEEHLRGATGMEVVGLPQGRKGDETCGCYDIEKHKCKCKSDVCGKNACQNPDKDRYFWTGGCSCGCDGMVVGSDCPEKPPHLEDVDEDVKRAAAGAVAAAALGSVQPAPFEEHLRGAVSEGADDDDDDVPTGCGCYEFAHHKCVCDSNVCSKTGCLLHLGMWTGGCSSCMCDGLVVGEDCPAESVDDAKVRAEKLVATPSDRY